MILAVFLSLASASAAHDLVEMLGQCDVADTLNEARATSGMPTIPNGPEFDKMCQEARMALDILRAANQLDMLIPERDR